MLNVSITLVSGLATAHSAATRVAASDSTTGRYSSTSGWEDPAGAGFRFESSDSVAFRSRRMSRAVRFPFRVSIGGLSSSSTSCNSARVCGLSIVFVERWTLYFSYPSKILLGDLSFQALLAPVGSVVWIESLLNASWACCC